MSNIVTLPDLFAIIDWPYHCKVNPHYLTNAWESKKWVEAFELLAPNDLAAFHRYDFPLLGAVFYPTVTKEHHRLAVDMIHWMFIIDAITDVQSTSATREFTNTIVEVLRDPSKPLPIGTHALGEMTRDMLSRVREFSVPSSADRFRKELELYIDAVFDEVENRELGRIYSSIEEYRLHRRNTVAATASLEVNTFTTDMPENVISHPRFRRLLEDATDLIWMHNDLYSYNIERKRGLHAHNLVTTVMKEKSIGVQDAIDYCGELYRQTSQSYFDNLNNVPTLSYDEQHALSLYADGIGYLVAGQHEWTHKSTRYLGDEGDVVRVSREIELADECVIEFHSKGNSMQ